MGPETDTVEPVLAGRLNVCLFVCLSVWDVCPGMYEESGAPILMQLLLLLTVMV